MSGRTKLIKIAANELTIHPKAQRSIVPKKLEQLKREMNLDAIGTLQAVPYRGRYAVVDGQHRLRALLDLRLGDWKVDVSIHVDIKTEAEAARLFLELNDRTNVKAYEKYKNQLTAKDPTANGIEKILTKYGLRSHSTGGDGHVCCFAELNRIFKKDNGESLELAIKTILSSWGKRQTALEGKVIGGFGRVFTRFNGHIDEQTLTAKMAKYDGGPGSLIGDAKMIVRLERQSLSSAVAKIIVDQYNRRRSTGRLEW